MAALCKRYIFVALTLLWLPCCQADFIPIPPINYAPPIHSKTPESLAAAKKIQLQLNEHTHAMPRPLRQVGGAGESYREEPSDDDDVPGPGFSFHLHKLHPDDSHRPGASEARNPPVPATLPSKPPEMPSILHPQQPEPEERDESWLNPMWRY